MPALCFRASFATVSSALTIQPQQHTRLSSKSRWRLEQLPALILTSSSRVEKNRRPEKARLLPAWFYRVLTIDVLAGGDVDPEEYDEDLSGLQEELGEEKDEYEHCNGDDFECEC